MPYIRTGERQQYQAALDEIARLVPQDRQLRPGHMNYVISLLIRKVYGDRLRYADHNEVLGVLQGVSLEFYRRHTAPYEDQKIAEEGDLDRVE